MIYLHCNTGSRLDVVPYLPELIQQNFSVCSFDFSGCGNSDGNYITLGYSEKDDIEAVLNYLQGLGKYEHFFLWGRSMGATAALFYITSSKQNLVKGIVLDSAFYSLKKMVLEYASQVTKLPQFLIYPILPLVNKYLKEKADLEIEDFEIKGLLEGMRPLSDIPAVLFLTSKQDAVVKSKHSEQICKHYPGKEKQIKYIQEKHEQDRPLKVIQECVEFFKKTEELLQKKNNFGFMPFKQDLNDKGFSPNRLWGSGTTIQMYQQPVQNSSRLNLNYNFLNNRVYI